MENNLSGPSLFSKSTNIIVFIILAIYPLVGMGIDLIAPALPGISRDLNISSLISKNLISTYLIGYALGNFFIGFLSDALGRRKLLLGGFLSFIVISLLPALFPSAISLLVARFFQGAALAAFGVIGRAILSDVLPTERLLQVAVLVATMWGLGPILGPVIGGYLQFYFNWHACFYFFAIFGFIGFLSFYFFVPETLFNLQPLNISQIKKNFMIIVTHRVFMGMVLSMGLVYSLLIVFNTLGPFFIQSELGFSSIYYGHLALILGLVYLVSTFVCKRLIKVFNAKKVIFVTILVTLLLSFFACGFAIMVGKNIWVTIIPSAIMFFACGIIYPTGMAFCISLFRNISGSATAIMILFNFFLTSIIGTLMSFVNATTALSIVGIYFLIMLSLTGIYLAFLRK